MKTDKTGHPDRAATKAARAAEMAEAAGEVWRGVKAQEAERDVRTARLKAERLAHEAKATATARNNGDPSV